jgi:hypothetical protein
VGLVFPRADRPIAVEWAGYPVVRLRPIEGLEFVEEAVIALGSSTELATHLFRECWGSERAAILTYAGCSVEAHQFKVATAADPVALWHNGRITVDRGQKEVSAAAHARSVAASQA